MTRHVLFLAWMLQAACLPSPADGPEPRPDDASLVALGDSVFAFHRERDGDIPHVVGDLLGVTVYNVAQSGAQMTGGDAPIPAQLPDGPWEWVLIDGGANDLADRCGCDECDAVLDEMISEDAASGLIPTLAAEVTEDGGKLAIMGYYALPADAPAFEGCAPWVQRLATRQATLAAADPGVYFADASEVIDGTDPKHFFPDKVHPSVAGGAIAAAHVAARLQASE